MTRPHSAVFKLDLLYLVSSVSEPARYPDAVRSIDVAEQHVVTHTGSRHVAGNDANAKDQPVRGSRPTGLRLLNRVVAVAKLEVVYIVAHAAGDVVVSGAPLKNVVGGSIEHAQCVIS